MKFRLMLLACVLAGPALAQYKVVQPDGRITYTDRAPIGDNAGTVTSIGRRGVAPPGSGTDVSLPLELRQAASRYPVTLYAGAECPACDDARKMLQQRGVPFAERQVLIEDDAVALVQLSGGRTLPTLTIGAQPLRGWSPGDWAAYLDAAGYPRESRLPRGWKPAAATPLAPRAAASAASGSAGGV